MQPFLKEFARWVRYLYFMRFGIILWAFAPLLCWANDPQIARSLVSGIVTPSNSVQYLCVSFFLVSASFVALILARIAVINGEQRFGDQPPEGFEWLLANHSRSIEWIAPVASQINNVYVFWYFLSNGCKEGIDSDQVGQGLLAGFLLALLFWYAVNAIYYLTYDPGRHAGKVVANTILFPRSWLFLSRSTASVRFGEAESGEAKPGEVRSGGVRFGDALEDAKPLLPYGWIARFFPVAGYRWPPDGGIYEGHYFSLISACGFFALYWAMWPLTAPMPVPGWSRVSVILYLLAGVAVLALVLRAQPGKASERRKLLVWKILLAVSVLVFGLAIPFLYYTYGGSRFPVLALVLILIISSAWTLGAIAFYADRFRIPVLTLIVLATVIPRHLHLTGAREEHYLSTATTSDPEKQSVPTPEDILSARRNPNDAKPLIIVTATGGGLHASAWTVAILARLEQQLGPDFHKHLLLASTVSGGSVGLLAYLRELHEGTLDQKDPSRAIDRMQAAAQCSSLEGVGWGLVYYDIPKAFVPLFPYFVPPSPGNGDLDHSPLYKDRTWSLRRSFVRNLDDAYCEHLWASDKGQETDWQHTQNNVSSPEASLTLRDFLHPDAFPAFTMNTTSVEDGQRFLLANYKVSSSTNGSESGYRARSFLATFGGSGGANDLPLATAAQMSATFPLVSSAARVPVSIYDPPDSPHFVDGGYYDNDGTASAIEFLRYALAADSKGPPLRILLIETRNSGDVPPPPPESNPDRTGATSPWNLSDQLSAPLLAFWQAGHESVTIRNRVSLALLQKALEGKLELHRLVLADNDSAANAWTDPLNWSLTPRQRKEVQSSAAALQPCYIAATTWFSNWDSQWAQWGKKPQATDAGCDPKANMPVVGATP